MLILENLKIYQFLSPLQMVMSGVSPNIKTVRDKLIKPLIKRKKPLLNVYDFGFVPTVGRLSKIYCLSPYGASVLAESLGVDLQEIPYPKKGIQFANDYFHRKICIDFHINFRNWIEQTDRELLVYDNYFGRVKTAISYTSQTAVTLNSGLKIIADSIAVFEKRMFALEIHNTKQTAKIIRQLDNHLSAIQEKAISTKYQHPKNCPVLSLFTHKGTMEATKKRLLQKIFELKAFKGFLFNSLENVNQDITQGWHLIDNTPVNFFKG